VIIGVTTAASLPEGQAEALDVAVEARVDNGS
jgi:hypothetical protein